MLHLGLDAGRPAARNGKLVSARARLVTTSIGAIDVYETGNVDGEAIVLVTHGLGSLESFEEIADGLATRFPHRRIVAYSRPGRGRSPALNHAVPGEDLASEASLVLPALMRALGIRSADFVGHSDGAAIAALAACLNPGLAGRLVAIAPQVFADAQFARATDALPEEHRRIGLSERLGALHLDDAGAFRLWRAARQGLCAKPNAVLDRLEGLTAPILLVQGLRDEFGSSNQVSMIATRASGPVKWVLLQRDGHFVHLDNPGQMLDLIESHLATPPARQDDHWSTSPCVARA